MKGRAPGPFSWLPSSTVAFPRQLPPGEHLERQPWEQPWLCLPRSSAPVGRASPTAGQYPQQRASPQNGRSKSSHVAEAGQSRKSSTGCQGLGRRLA